MLELCDKVKGFVLQCLIFYREKSHMNCVDIDPYFWLFESCDSQIPYSGKLSREKTFSKTSSIRISRRKLSQTGTYPRNSRKFSPSKVSRHAVAAVWITWDMYMACLNHAYMEKCTTKFPIPQTFLGLWGTCVLKLCVPFFVTITFLVWCQHLARYWAIYRVYTVL